MADRRRHTRVDDLRSTSGKDPVIRQKDSRRDPTLGLRLVLTHAKEEKSILLQQATNLSAPLHLESSI